MCFFPQTLPYSGHLTMSTAMYMAPSLSPHYIHIFVTFHSISAHRMNSTSMIQLLSPSEALCQSSFSLVKAAVSLLAFHWSFLGLPPSPGTASVVCPHLPGANHKRLSRPGMRERPRASDTRVRDQLINVSCGFSTWELPICAMKAPQGTFQKFQGMRSCHWLLLGYFKTRTDPKEITNLSERPSFL